MPLYGPVTLGANTFTGGQTVASGTITANAPLLNLSQTWNNAGVDFLGVDLQITNTNGGANSTPFRIGVGGSDVFRVYASGFAIASTMAASSNFQIPNNFILAPTGTTGQAIFENYAVTAGVGFDFATDGTLKLRNRAFGADASFTAAAGTFSGAVVNTASTIQYMGTATGLVNVMAVTPSPAITAYTTGAMYFVLANLANTTTTPTLNISGLGAKTIVKRAATALAAGDYVASMMCLFVYDGTNMELLNPVVN